MKLALQPQVSVVIPVRNGAQFITECLASALGQSMAQIEVVVIDDGSTDGTPELVRAQFGSDSRVRISPARGRGLVAALNQGLKLARAPLVARLDADDRAHPERLALQASCLQDDANLGLVSCQVHAFPSTNLGAGMLAYLTWQDTCQVPSELADNLFIESPFVHSSVMFRRELVLRHGGYLDGIFPEDYELWLRLAQRGVPMMKINRRLVDWRQSSTSLSRTDPRYARRAFDYIRAKYLAMDRRLHSGRALAFWGAGRKTRLRCRYLMEHGFRPTLWVDIDPRKIGNTVWGAPVVAPDHLNRYAPSERPLVLVYVANHGARDLIGAALDGKGYKAGGDYLLVG